MMHIFRAPKRCCQIKNRSHFTPNLTASLKTVTSYKQRCSSQFKPQHQQCPKQSKGDETQSGPGAHLCPYTSCECVRCVASTARSLGSFPPPAAAAAHRLKPYLSVDLIFQTWLQSPCLSQCHSPGGPQGRGIPAVPCQLLTGPVSAPESLGALLPTALDPPPLVCLSGGADRGAGGTVRCCPNRETPMTADRGHCECVYE